jgi:uncharacterized coiled-coil DUF342 family protein
MGTQLDLDDVVTGNPLAESQLANLRSMLTHIGILRAQETHNQMIAERDAEIDQLRAQVEALKAALTEISEMGEGYATAMVITADKALDALREEE